MTVYQFPTAPAVALRAGYFLSPDDLTALIDAGIVVPVPGEPPEPPPAPWPDGTNTGFPADLVLVPRGSMTVGIAGTVLDGLDFTGMVTVTAPDVVIRRSRFTGSGQSLAIRTRAAGRVQVEDSTFRGNFTTAAIGYDNWTALRCDFSGLPSDGVKLGSHTHLEDCFMHDFATATGAHADGAQVETGVADVVVRHNSILLAERQNAAVFIRPSLGPDGAGPVVVENNRLAGGNYTLYAVRGGAEGEWTIEGVAVLRNRFVPVSKYGPLHSNMPIELVDNVWDDTGQPLPA